MLSCTLLLLHTWEKAQWILLSKHFWILSIHVNLSWISWTILKPSLSRGCFWLSTPIFAVATLRMNYVLILLFFGIRCDFVDRVDQFVVTRMVFYSWIDQFRLYFINSLMYLEFTCLAGIITILHQTRCWYWRLWLDMMWRHWYILVHVQHTGNLKRCPLQRKRSRWESKDCWIMGVGWKHFMFFIASWIDFTARGDLELTLMFYRSQ